MGEISLTKLRNGVLGLALWALSGVAGAVQPGDAAPEWELTTGDGEVIAFPAHADGAPAILFFWATWCPYCHAVMPYLDQIRKDYAEHRVNVYAIDFKDDGDPVEHMAELGYGFVVLPLGDLVADDYGVWGAPGILVVDGDGTVAYRRGDTRAPPGTAIAEQWDREVRAALDRTLGR